MCTHGMHMNSCRQLIAQFAPKGIQWKFKLMDVQHFRTQLMDLRGKTRSERPRVDARNLCE